VKKQAADVQKEKLFQSAPKSTRKREFEKPRSETYPCWHCNRHVGWHHENCPFCKNSLEVPF
jgi:hypothetical protein